MTAFAGSVAGALAVATLFAARPALMLDMDRELKDAGTGFFPPERAGEETFAWTSAVGTLTLRDFDRRGPWQCELRLRGPRPEGSAVPTVEVAADGLALINGPVSPEYQRLAFTVPARSSASDLTLTIRTAPTFVPGPHDKRELGVQVDHLGCAPADRRLVFAPSSLILAGAATAAAFGAVAGLIPAALLSLLAGVAGFAVVQAVPLTTGLAPFTGYSGSAIWLAAGVFAPAAAVIGLIRRRQAFAHPAAPIVAALSAAMVFLKLLALLHPAKFLVDAVFHAHRLEWVLDGRYYFSQPLRDAQFPYAIGLYVVAAPFAALTGDHVLLLRVVVCVVQALAGALLYTVTARHWNDRAAGVLAVVLFHCVPLPYVIVGNANLTYAFAQAVSVATLAAATTLTFGPRHVFQWIVLFGVASLAFLSHVGTFPLTLAALLALAGFYWIFGGAALRVPAWAIATTTLVAVVFSVAIYWGHFSEVYATFDRVLGRTPAAAAGAAVAGVPAMPTPRIQRTQTAFLLAVESFGWPLILLAGLGAWQLYARGVRNRAGLAICAWSVAGLAFVAISVLMPVDRSFERYADEFITRVYDTTIPAVALLGALAVTWAWRWPWLRAAALALVVAAAAQAFQQWHSWIV